VVVVGAGAGAGAGAVVEVDDGLEVVVDVAGGTVGCWRGVVAVGSGAVMDGVRTAVVLVVGRGSGGT